MFRHVAPWLGGDVVFANLETVVTERNDLRALDKAFTFRSHPAGLAYLAGLGVNAVSLANNHAIDYGETGLRETLLHMERLRTVGLVAAPGVGAGRARAIAPAAVNVRGLRVQIGALGIGSSYVGAGSERAAMAAWPGDLSDTVDALRDAAGDLRMLSVHYNQEMAVRPSPGDAQRLRDVVLRQGIDLVAGHHAHVAAGVQHVGGGLIFYGLGNFAHPGMQDMGHYGVCRDYGLMARIHYARAAGDRFQARAIEVVTLDDMHSAPRPRTGEDGRARIAVLNHLAGGLDGPGDARGLQFTPRADGTGLACLPGAAQEPGRIGALCREAAVAADANETARHRRAAASSCGSQMMAGRERGRSQAMPIAVFANPSKASGATRDEILGWAQH
jgi:poly-gamma-glutamate synthesis protein (capsule biosynthesis protein)